MYRGMFKGGKMEGFGVYFYEKKKEKYIGYWKNEEYNGDGYIENEKGEKIKIGVYENNKLIENKLIEELNFE